MFLSKFRKLTEAPLGYWEKSSFMMVIPSHDEDNLLGNSIKRLDNFKEIKIKENNYSIEKNCIILKLEYQKEEYEVGVYEGGISVPEYYLKNAIFTEEDRKLLLDAKRAITIFMDFNENIKKCYHLQLKVAAALIPDLAGVLDESAEAMLHRKWVLMTANSKILPSAKNMFSVQSIFGKNKEIWMHTHGLCRCGYTELEILGSDEANQENHYYLLNNYAMYLIDKKKRTDPEWESVFIGRLNDGSPIVLTCVSWTRGLKEYKGIDLGGLKDRKTGHNSKTSIIFAYKTPQDEENKKLSLISDFNEALGSNPLLFFSDEETERMSAVARERFDYVKKAFKTSDNSVLIKIGLPLKEEGKAEHIWFELLEIKGNKFKAKLTQEPYYIEGIHTGYESWYTIDDITDWIIYTPTLSVNPDNAFVLDNLKK